MNDLVLGRAQTLARPISVVSRRLSQRAVILGLVVADALALGLAFWVAWMLRFNNPWLPYVGPVSKTYHVDLVVICVPLYIMLFAMHRLYDHGLLFGGTEEYARVVHACTFGMAMVIVYSFFQRDGEAIASRGWILALLIASISIVGVERFIYRRAVHALRKRGWLRARAVILGVNEEAQAVAEQLRSTTHSGLQLVGLVDNGLQPSAPLVDGLEVVGAMSDLPQLVPALGIEEIVIAPTAVSRQQLLDLYGMVDTRSTVHLSLSSGLFEVLTTGVQVRDVGNVPLMSLNHLRIRGSEAAMKMVVDYVLSTAVLIVLSPLMLALAVLVKRSSPGPVLHRRCVLGARGHTFEALKFRTMVVDADGALERLFAERPDLEQEYKSGMKLKDDPRVTRLGRVLRKYSLDELPQFFNVLKGEMSVVGPRMIAPEESERYGKWKMNLLTVKPGITGPWQVMGRNDLPYEERVRLSMHYIRNYSIWLDLKILLETVNVVLKGRGAY